MSGIAIVREVQVELLVVGVFIIWLFIILRLLLVMFGIAKAFELELETNDWGLAFLEMVSLSFPFHFPPPFLFFRPLLRGSWPGVWNWGHGGIIGISMESAWSWIQCFGPYGLAFKGKSMRLAYE